MGCSPSIGINKGTLFAPDDRMRALLTEAAAVAVANGAARAISFKSRDPKAYLYPNRRRQTGFIGTTTGGSAMTGRPAATSTPGRCSSTSRP